MSRLSCPVLSAVPCRAVPQVLGTLISALLTGFSLLQLARWHRGPGTGMRHTDLAAAALTAAPLHGNTAVQPEDAVRVVQEFLPSESCWDSLRFGALISATGTPDPLRHTRPATRVCTLYPRGLCMGRRAPLPPLCFAPKARPMREHRPS